MIAQLCHSLVERLGLCVCDWISFSLIMGLDFCYCWTFYFCELYTQLLVVWDITIYMYYFTLYTVYDELLKFYGFLLLPLSLLFLSSISFSSAQASSFPSFFPFFLQIFFSRIKIIYMLIKTKHAGKFVLARSLHECMGEREKMHAFVFKRDNRITYSTSLQRRDLRPFGSSSIYTN